MIHTRNENAPESQVSDQYYFTSFPLPSLRLPNLLSKIAQVLLECLKALEILHSACCELDVSALELLVVGSGAFSHNKADASDHLEPDQ